MNWQPIETAPKDGTDVLLWCGWAITGLYHDGQWRTEDKRAPIYMATHWIPLPEPPEEQQ
jgi:hypothetical protein